MNLEAILAHVSEREAYKITSQLVFRYGDLTQKTRLSTIVLAVRAVRSLSFVYLY